MTNPAEQNLDPNFHHPKKTNSKNRKDLPIWEHFIKKKIFVNFFPLFFGIWNTHHILIYFPYAVTCMYNIGHV